MKKFKKALLSLTACILSAMMLFAFAGCGEEKKPDDGDTTAAKITGITMDPTTKDMDAGDTLDLKVTASLDDNTTKRVYARDGLTYESSDAAVASVNASGTVEAKKAGTATIKAKIETYEATCTVTVHSLTVEIDETELTLEKDSTATLTATVKRDGTALTGDAAKVEWTSSNADVASVSAAGVVTAKSKGTTTITATKGGQSAACAVEVIWTPPVGYNPIAWAEQNKLVSNTWGYWNGREANWGAGLAKEYDVYTDSTFVESETSLQDGYEYIKMGKITFEFEITQPDKDHVYQAFYRSSDNVEGGLLHYNHVYELTFKAKSNVEGPIIVNPYDDVRKQGDDESKEDYEAYLQGLVDAGKMTADHVYNLPANTETEIKVIFLHDDCGYVYKQGIYDNMGSALHIQMGRMPANEKITLSVWDFQYKDLGEATNKGVCDETKHDGYVDPDATNPDDIPTDLPATPEAKTGVVATKALLVAEDNKAIFQIEGTVDMTQFDSKEAAETWIGTTLFDLQQCGGTWFRYRFRTVSATVDESAGTFVVKYDITYLGVDAAAYTCHFQGTVSGSDVTATDLKLDAEGAVHGQSITVGTRKYSISNVVGGSDQSTNWGCVSVKVEKA